MKITRFLSPLVLAPALVLAACQQAETPSTETEPDGKPGLSVSEGKLILPAVKGNPGAAYFTLANGSDAPATLVGVYIDGADKTEMHFTTEGKMAPLDQVQLDPGTSVKFERGGKHVMAFGLADTVTPGGTTEMTLTFEGGDKLSAPLQVESIGGGAMMDMDHSEQTEGSH